MSKEQGIIIEALKSGREEDINMIEIICYNCIYCLEKYSDDTVECEVKGKVDVHGVCDYYWKR